MISLFEVDTTRENCDKCGLHLKCKSPFMKTGGNGKLKLMVIAEAPGSTEDEYNDQLIGEAGQELEKIFKKFGFDLHEDFWKENTLCCRPEKNKTPTKTQIKYCRERLLTEVRKRKPKAIITLGAPALEALFGTLKGKASVTSMDGLKIPYHDLGCWVLPLLHPSKIVREKHDKNLMAHWERTVRSALRFCGNLPDLEKYKVYPEKHIKFVMKIEDVRRTFKYIKDHPEEAVAIDYETSGLNMYNENHFIYSFALALENGRTYSIPLDHPEAPWTDEEYFEVQDSLKKFLRAGKNYLIAHNSTYEMNASRNILGIVPKINWCTSVTQHICDVRPNITGLKFQAFVRWGIHYSEDTQKYIKNARGSNLNKMHKQPLSEQLLYVGSDAYLTMKLFKKQEKEVPNFKCVEFFNSAVRMLERVTHNGMRVNKEFYLKQIKEVEEEVKAIEKEIQESKEVQQYLKEYKLKKLDIDSPKELVPFFYDFLELPVVHRTDKLQEPAAHENALLDMNHWIAQRILDRRKVSNIVDSFISQILREETNGWIHPEFTLNVARSLRSSAVRPSIQNFPKRWEEAKKRIRSGIHPAKGHKMMEADFSGIEVGTSAIYHQDPTFISYLEDENSDMHRDNTCDLWLITEDEIIKKLRFFGKNGWTFPQFYGDYYGSCAENLWKNCLDLELNGVKLKVRDHLKTDTFKKRFKESEVVKIFMKEGIRRLSDKDQERSRTAYNIIQKTGITNLELFKEYCRMVEYYMWYVRFPVYTEWKEQCQRDYQEKGYVETKLGFKYTGYLDKKQVANYPIQGTAFHLLLWSMIEVQKIAIKEKWKSFFMGEIHDSMIMSVDPAEEKHVKEVIQYVCTVKIREEFPWINVPYKIDIEETEIDGSWYDMKEAA